MNLLLRALAAISGLPHNSRRNFVSVMVGNSGASMRSSETIDGLMAESWDPKGSGEKALMANSPTIGQILTTLEVLMKWSECFLIAFLMHCTLLKLILIRKTC